MEFLNLAILTFCVIFKGFAFWIDSYGIRKHRNPNQRIYSKAEGQVIIWKKPTDLGSIQINSSKSF